MVADRSPVRKSRIFCVEALDMPAHRWFHKQTSKHLNVHKANAMTVAPLKSTVSKTEARANRSVDLALIGATGRIGRQVLNLLSEREAEFESSGVNLRLVAIANSRATFIDTAGIAPANAAALLERAMVPANLASFARLTGRPLVVVDCTASTDVVANYPKWLASGIDIVTPNKLGPSADRALHQTIASAGVSSRAILSDSTTVGAQLPLLSALRELRQAGDRVDRIEAVLSGTLSYVLSAVQDGDTLSSAVRAAVAQGYAEPNPAGDLSGEDAARKLVILLRALGHDLELGDVERVPLVDDALLRETDPTQLLHELSSADELWRARAAIAQALRERWIYRASFENGKARVAPERVPLSHSLADLKPCENALILHSRYYRAAPLTIRGPGAGIELTAAGVFADILAIAHSRARAATFDRGSIVAAA